jgi:cysteine desulfurase
LKEIAVSSGSACTSASLEPSYVLRAIGVKEDLAHTSIRFGLFYLFVVFFFVYFVYFVLVFCLSYFRSFLFVCFFCLFLFLFSSPFPGLGRFTTDREIDYTINLLTKHVLRLREMSPLWEMVQEGIDLQKIQWTGHA